ncbi:MAG TPA: hypothetical protein VK934_09590 [Fimbriimonas sp.]|nr:hypothetical protein [Fimbriimonas sp.]
MALGELRSTTACLVSVQGTLCQLPRGCVSMVNQGGVQILAAPDAEEALLFCKRSISEKAAEKASLMLCQITDENVLRAGDLLRHVGKGQFVVTLPVQDLLRDSSSEPEFLDVGRVELRGRSERIFLVDVGVHKEPQIEEPPAGWTPFIGRRVEFDKLSSLLTTARVVSVSGSPGIGKSGLLRRFFSEQESLFENGGWFIDFRQIRSGHFAIEAVCRAIGISKLPGESREEALVATLREKASLLILDNCQAVLPEVRKLVALLSHKCPQLALVIGSRKVPRIAGETRMRLEGLECPSFAEDWRAMKDVDAVALFVDRAAAADSQFCLSDNNAADIAQLCERLDGNPLAIELVAAKVTLLTPRQILGRLQDRFLLFKDATGENRLEETLTWSYEQLGPPARQLLGCLSTFNGSFSLDAASFVCSAIDLPEQEMMWAFEDLLDNSLITPGVTLAASKQFYITETVRSFAAKQFASCPQRADVERKHREWCLSFASQAARELHGPRQAEWLEAIDGAYHDLRAVINAGCLPRGDLEMASKTLLACFPYFVERSYFREGLAICEKVCTVRGVSALPQHPQVLNMAGALSFYLSDWHRCRTYAIRSIRAARNLRDPLSEGMARCTAGLAAQSIDDKRRAHREYLQALSLLRSKDENKTLIVLGNILGLEADMRIHKSAEAHLVEAKGLMERATDLGTISSVYLNGAHLYFMRGQWAQSWDWYLRCVMAAAELKSDYSILLALRGMVPVLLAAKELEAAANLVGAVKSLQSRAESQPLDEGRVFDSSCEELKERLGSQEYAQALLEGQSWRLDQLVDGLRTLGRTLNFDRV